MEKEILTRGVQEIINKEHLMSALKSGKKLRVKFGIDPTAPDLHLGHAAPLRKLRQFQDAGHKAILIIGDYTARIGDPSGRAETRSLLTEKQVQQNMKEYLKQAGKIIDLQKAEIRHNSEWLEKSLADLIELSRAASIQQVLRRADFRKRLREGQDITLLELLYPLFQGYDSVKIKADVEIGGEDQKFNLLMGRRVQRHFGMVEQDLVLVPLLEGTDGVKKMSKTYNNYIAFTESPQTMFNKIMLIPDKLINKYQILLTNLNPLKLKPREAKERLAFEIVKEFHGEKSAQKSKEEFNKVFKEKKLPSKIPQVKIKKGQYFLADLFITLKLASSKSEAKRLIEQGALEINNNILKDWKRPLKIEKNAVLKLGKRRFVGLTVI